MTTPTSTPSPAYAPYAAEPKTNTLAIISLISAFVIPLAGIITGHISLSQIKRTGEKGRGMAVAGLILGYVGVLFVFFIFVLVNVINAIAIASS